MVSSRTLTAVVGLLVSLAATVAIYLATGWLFVFLFVPFVPFLFRGVVGRGDRAVGAPSDEGGAGGTARTCPTCGFRTTDGRDRYCPRDGTPLRETSEPRDGS